MTPVRGAPGHRAGVLMALLAGWLCNAGIAQTLDAASLETAEQLREAALADGTAMQVVESLTTEVGPRMAGSAGDARAVAWAQKKFQQLGFDRVALEPVTFPLWRRGSEQARVVAPYEQPLIITALGGSVGTDGEELVGEVVAFSDLEQLKSADPGVLTGKIAYVGARMARFRDGRGYGPVVAARSQGAVIAAGKGARALLIRSVGTDSDRLPHTGLMSYEEGVPRIPAAALSNPDADLLERMLERPDPVQVGLTLGAGWHGEYTSHNVIGDIVGSERPDEIVLIGGHLDSWDLGTGAIDDGAGCAITMAAAALIGKLERRPARTIRVVLFANEEQGLWGARAYQQAHFSEIDRHIIGAESDFGAGPIYRFSTRVKPSALGLVDQINQVLAPLGIVRGNNNAGGGPDLIPLRRSGMAVATLHQDGSDYFDYHHTANDTLDKIDPEALAQNVAAYAVFAYLAAQAPDDFGFGLGLESSTD